MSESLNATEMRGAKAILRSACQQLTDEDLNQLQAGLPAPLLYAVMRPLDPRFLSPRRINARLREQIPAQRPHMLEDLFAPMFGAARELMTDEQWGDPSEADLTETVAELHKAWSPHATTAFLAVVALIGVKASNTACSMLPLENPARDTENDADRVQAADISLQAEESDDGSDRLMPMTLPDIDEDVYTPFGRLMIASAVATAHGQVGAMAQDDFEAALNEVLKLNGTHLQTWFLAGFAVGMGVASESLLLDAPSANEERRQWRLWGVIKGLQRRGHTAVAATTLSESPSRTREMFASDLAPEMAPFAIQALLDAHWEFATELLNVIPTRESRPISYELEIARAIDDHSVSLLRRDAPGAAVLLLQSALTRLTRVSSVYGDNPRWQTSVSELRVRLTMGLAAGLRMQGNNDQSVEAMESLAGDVVVTASPRTQARYFTQRFLSAIDAKRIESVSFPRTADERARVLERFGPHQDLLSEAAKASPLASDAQYLLAALAAGREDHESLAIHLGHCRSGYEGRKDRGSLLAVVKWEQLLTKLLHDDAVGALESLERLSTEIPDEIRINAEESTAIIQRVADRSPTLLGRTASILVAVRHQAPSNDALVEMMASATRPDESFIDLISKEPSRSQRLELLSLLLEKFLDEGDPDQIDRILEAVDRIRHDGGGKAHLMWAKELATNAALRRFLGEEDADMQAVAEYALIGDSNEAAEEILGIALRQSNVQSEAAYLRWQTLVETLRSVDAQRASLLDDDPRGNLPTTYTPYAPEELKSELQVQNVRVLFVGGDDERQTEPLQRLILALQETHPGIELSYILPGWSSKWMPKFREVEAALDNVDAVVLMPYFRTNFGHRVREAIREHRSNLTWVACGGTGQTQMKNQVLLATELALRVRSKARA